MNSQFNFVLEINMQFELIQVYAYGMFDVFDHFCDFKTAWQYKRLYRFRENLKKSNGLNRQVLYQNAKINSI